MANTGVSFLLRLVKECRATRLTEKIGVTKRETKAMATNEIWRKGPYYCQQKVYAIAGRSVKFKCMFQMQFGHGDNYAAGRS